MKLIKQETKIEKKAQIIFNINIVTVVVFYVLPIILFPFLLLGGKIALFVYSNSIYSLIVSIFCIIIGTMNIFLGFYLPLKTKKKSKIAFLLFGILCLLSSIFFIESFIIL